LAGEDSVNLSLANPHLEALRRSALLKWHHGFTLPANELSEFLAAGLSMKQFDLMVGAFRTAISPKQRFDNSAAPHWENVGTEPRPLMRNRSNIHARRTSQTDRGRSSFMTLKAT
jgi:hypothetical protein